MVRPPRGRALVAAVVGMVALAFAAAAVLHAHVGYVGGLDTHRTFAPPPPRPVEPVAVPSSERVWIVVVDGLRWDRARTLHGLRAMQETGVVRPLVADFPSFTAPSLTTLATGLPPLYSGVRLDGERARRLDSVSRRAARRGLAVFYDDGGREEIGRLLQLPVTALPASAERLIAAPPAGRHVVWLYIPEVDLAGHAHGAASLEYLRAAREVDAQIAALADALDPEQDTLVVLSDHGHLDVGGHGGAEPEARTGFLALRGPAVQARGVLPPAAMRDVAPTLAALIGTPPPELAVGRPLLDALGLEPPRDDREARWKDREMAVGFGAHAAPRLALAVLLVVCAYAFALLLHVRGVLRVGPRDLAPLVLYVGVFVGVYAASGYGLSWTLPRGREAFVLETLAFGLLGLTLALGQASRRRAAQEAWLGVLVLGAPFALASAWAGVDPRWLAGPRASFLVPFTATVGLYFWLPFGLRALGVVRRRWRARRRRQRASRIE